jgi:hypothetical protein
MQWFNELVYEDRHQRPENLELSQVGWPNERGARTASALGAFAPESAVGDKMQHNREMGSKLQGSVNKGILGSLPGCRTVRFLSSLSFCALLGSGQIRDSLTV